MSIGARKSTRAVIIGGSTGIGLASAQRLAQDGYKIVITGRNAQSLADAAKAIGANATTVQADTANLNDLPKLKSAI